MESASLQLGTAFVLGLLDSLFGHSRALIAGYFLDARRPARHALWLTLILIVTHTFMLVGWWRWRFMRGPGRTTRRWNWGSNLLQRR